MTVLTLKSGDFEESSRVAEFQNAAAAMCKLEISPADVSTFRSETAIGILPTAIIAQTTHSACTTVRTARLAAETGDNILVHIPLSGGFSMLREGGGDVVCTPGDIYIDPNEVPGVAVFHPERTDALYVSLPRGMMESAGAGLNGVLRTATTLTPQWRLFAQYARALNAELALLPPEQALQCSAHLHDLALMALGAGREATEIAQGRGVRAARLSALKADIERHLTAPELSPGWIAARHGLSQRYIRALFAGEGTSFRDHVASRRLLLAHRMLCDPTHGHRSISGIAMAAGFGDLSWFNAQFRRMFGKTPGEARAEARALLHPE